MKIWARASQAGGAASANAVSWGGTGGRKKEEAGVARVWRAKRN